MFDRESNIDIIFRNGLKDFEVLPPGDVWEQIPPVRSVRNRYKSLLGIAAGLAALVTLSLIASGILKIRSDSGVNTQMAAIIDASEPIVKPQIMASASVPEVTPAAYFSEKEQVITNRTFEEPVKNFTGPVYPSLVLNESITLAENVIPEIVSDNTDFDWLTFPDLTIDVFTPDNNLALLEKPAKEGHRFSLGASVSPAFSFTEPGEDFRLNELMDNERSLANYSTGLTFAYKLSPRFSLQSGVGLSSIGQLVSGVEIFAGLSDYYSVKGEYLYSVQTASGVILSTNNDLFISDNNKRVGSYSGGNIAGIQKRLDYVANDIRQVFRYLEVPLVIRYKLFDRKVDVNLSGGMAYGILVENKAFVNDGTNNINIGSTQGVNMFNVSSQVGLGMEYNISKQMSFNVEPVFRYYLTPFSNLSSTITRPYSFGLFSGFFFRF